MNQQTEEVIMERPSKEQGITLISLVVTIIILLILAGVTIGLISGSDGILGRATASVDKTHMESAKEQVTLKIGEYQSEFYEGKYVTQEIDNASQQGDWIFENYGRQTLQVKDYEFIINLPEGLEKADSENPYIVTINKNRKLLGKVTGTLSVDGILKWDENWVADGSSGEENKPDQGGDKTEEGDKNQYKITYYKNDGTDQKQEQTIAIGTQTTLTLDQFTRAGYELEGWYVNAECTGEKITTTNTNIILYAKWIEKATLESLGSITVGGITYENGFEIWNKRQLENFRDRVNAGEKFENCLFMQKADLNLYGVNWTAIGTETNYFAGSYDGENHKIAQVKVENNNTAQGLFGYVKGAILENLILEDGVISAGNKVGGLVGHAKDSEIRNIRNNSTWAIANSTYSEKLTYTQTLQRTELIEETFSLCSVGGICGVLENSNITDCTIPSYTAVTVRGCEGGRAIGGIVGYAKSSKSTTIQSCLNRSSLYSYQEVGGIVGLTNGAVTISDCANEARIEAKGYNCGGIVGATIGGAIRNCRNGNRVTAPIQVGGIAGAVVSSSIRDDVLVEACKNTGEVICSGVGIDDRHYINGVMQTDPMMYVGGIIGLCNNTTILKCYNQATISGGDNATRDANAIGGICGEIRDGKIEECYNQGNVRGTKHGMCMGGIVGIGYYYAMISNCYNAGLISGLDSVGGIIGWGGAANIRYCYNRGSVQGYRRSIGGVAGYLISLFGPSSPYTQNYLYYCYNVGRVTAMKNDTQYVGTVCGYFDYYDIDYIYTMDKSIDAQWGFIGHFKSGTNIQLYTSKNEIISAMLSRFGNKFKSDSDNRNDGYPILSWQ